LDSTKPANKLTFNMNTGIITGLISVRVKTLEVRAPPPERSSATLLRLTAATQHCDSVW